MVQKGNFESCSDLRIFFFFRYHWKEDKMSRRSRLVQNESVAYLPIYNDAFGTEVKKIEFFKITRSDVRKST